MSLLACLLNKIIIGWIASSPRRDSPSAETLTEMHSLHESCCFERRNKMHVRRYTRPTMPFILSIDIPKCFPLKIIIRMVGRRNHRVLVQALGNSLIKQRQTLFPNHHRQGFWGLVHRSINKVLWIHRDRKSSLVSYRWHKSIIVLFRPRSPCLKETQ